MTRGHFGLKIWSCCVKAGEKPPSRTAVILTVGQWRRCAKRSKYSSAIICSSTPTGRGKRLKPVTVSVRIRGGAPLTFIKKYNIIYIEKVKKKTHAAILLFILDIKKIVSCWYGPLVKRFNTGAFQAPGGGFDSPRGHQRLLSNSARIVELEFVGMDYY